MGRLQNNLKRYRLWKDEFADRLICVLGDLSRPLFGLAPAEFHDLSSQVDAIYHNGAQVNFIKPYEALKPANVLGRQEVRRSGRYRGGLGPTCTPHFFCLPSH